MLKTTEEDFQSSALLTIAAYLLLPAARLCPSLALRTVSIRSATGVCSGVQLHPGNRNRQVERFPQQHR